MTITANQFRTNFTAFANTELFPDPTIDFWLAVAYKLLPADRWSTMFDTAAELFVAHNVSLEARTLKEAANGKVPGQSMGMLSSKSVDKVSASYDTGSAAEENAGHWNLTLYGQRFIRLARMFGAGPVQIGAGCYDASNPLASINAWAGPWQSLYPNPS